MTFATSTAPDITEGLPANLSAQQGAAATSKRGQVQWDISVGGIGFNLGIDDQHQYIRESAPIQKQQTDVSTDAGEQTLDGLWIRSQTSWHLGAGANFYEPGARDGLTPTAYRFDKSVGVNVWDEGDLSLLKATSLVQATSGECYTASVRYGSADYYFTQTAGTLRRWTSATESPNAILAAGYSGGVSAVYSFTLETNTGGATPKLGQPFRVAEVPTGEEIHSMRSYLGTYIGLGTSRGLRVGILNNEGLQYGPLLFKTTKPVRALGASDRFLYAAVSGEIDGSSGCARVDLGTTIGNGLLFPWAWDAQTHATGEVNSLAFVGHSGRVVLGVTGEGAYAQSDTAFESTGYLLSGSIRYGTTESKAFRYADVRCRTKDGGSVSLSIVGPTGEEVPLVSLSGGSTGSNLSLASLAQRLEYISYKLTLTPSSGNTPVVESVALKAVPAVKKQRMIQYPVMMQEKQHDATKAPLRRDIPALIVDMEALEETQAVVTVNDYRTGESYPATIESFRFEGSTPSTGSRRGGFNVGGRGTLTVRKL